MRRSALLRIGGLLRLHGRRGQSGDCLCVKMILMK